MFSKILMYLVDFRVCSWLDVHPSPLFGPRNWTRPAVPRLICSSLMPRSYKLHSPTRKSSTSFERKATQHDWAKSRLFVQQKPLHGPRLTSFRKLRPASQELRMHPGTYWIFVVRELLIHFQKKLNSFSAISFLLLNMSMTHCHRLRQSRSVFGELRLWSQLISYLDLGYHRGIDQGDFARISNYTAIPRCSRQSPGRFFAFRNILHMHTHIHIYNIHAHPPMNYLLCLQGRRK